ncbi:UvrD-like DNA helicase, C-terminal [uncultured Caudovirales phage]|uniref:DNA 3'-5' helicase n=1 Tax=uncultured Caudovirales phage TaxID=2100421 RepID=A0A6J5P6U6_9CAUD|nr:UvrD-like DNA helicase, C-terminal [uncultured Caudovirales phage]
MKRLIYFGPPGTGKTTTLLMHLEDALIEGTPVENIAFLTFTRRARAEAVERVEKVLDISAKNLPHFRTIHSMAFKALGLKEGDVLAGAQLRAFGNGMGLNFGSVGLSEQAAEGLASQEKGDVLLAIDNLARLRGQPLRATWGASGCKLDWHVMQHFSSSYSAYKEQTGLMDFTDVLLEYVRRGSPLDVEIAFVDEAQDLSVLQWSCVHKAIRHARTQYVAGDDDQAIYRWAGADVESFVNLDGKRIVLSHSHRLPAAVHHLSQQIAHRIKTRVPKEFTAREDTGEVKWHASVDSLDVKKGQSWLWLVRNRYLLPPLQQRLELNGIVYSQHGNSSIRPSEREAIYDWERLRAGRAVTVERVRDIYDLLKTRTQIAHGHKALPKVAPGTRLTEHDLRDKHGLLASGTWFEVFASIPDSRRSYYRKLLRDNKTLHLDPQVQLETIHGAKGAEADYVALFTEQSRRVWDESQKVPDDEHRVWYVGATRARNSLNIVVPAGHWGYSIPRS